MDASNWIALLSVAVALLAIALPVMLRTLDRRAATILRMETEHRLTVEKYETEARTLREANWDLKLQLVQLKGVAQVIDRTFSALPRHPAEEPGS